MKKKFGRQDASTSYGSNPDKLPSDRNPGQQNHLDIAQNEVPAPGSPKPTQASTNATGKLGRK